MAEIHILDSETIDKIAAGEVVERPSSVVKELVENAIDAGAGAVTVEIKDGGIEFIRVTDNGCGMERGQLKKAFLRHATSKIETAEDLERISSLGFRGEALSSIAAVARVEVITRTCGSITGSRILLEGGKEIAFDEVGAPEGTTFLVRNLFYNTPARRKFLKQPATEGGYIADLMEHLALSRPDISFKLTIGNQMKFHTSGNGDLREVIYRIYGREVAGELIPIRAEQDGVRVEGYLGKPVQVRSNRNYEIYFINGRFVRSNVVAKALEEGYKEYLMQHKFPLCVLHITMDTGRVDVNVHPAKMEVRFGRAMEFCDYMMNSVRQTLRHQEMIPSAVLDTGKELREARKEEQKERVQNPAPEPFEKNRSNAYRLMEEANYCKVHAKEQSMMSNPVWNRVKETAPPVSANQNNQGPQPKMEQEAAVSGTADLRTADDESECFFEETPALPEDSETRKIVLSSGDDSKPGKSISSSRDDSEPGKSISSLRDDSKPGNDTSSSEGICPREEASSPSFTGVQLDLFEEKILTRENRSRFRIIGQVFETYWLIEFQEKLLMIDQHAAHEKVNYERLMKRYHEKSVLSQGLLPPVIVSLSGQEEAVLQENRDTFAALGFEIEAFGGSEYALRSVPVDLYGCNEREMFLEVLDGLMTGTGFGSIRVIEEKIASMSCKAAVKGNQKLSTAEAEALVDELLTLENPYNCPHGRPVIVSMTKTEMDRKFKRIVG